MTSTGERGLRNEGGEAQWKERKPRRWLYQRGAKREKAGLRIAGLKGWTLLTRKKKGRGKQGSPFQSSLEKRKGERNPAPDLPFRCRARTRKKMSVKKKEKSKHP